MPVAWQPPDRYRGVVEFAQRYLWVELREGGREPFRINRAQQYLLDAKAKHLDAGGQPRFLILKGRRLGISTWEQIENYHAVADAPNRHVVTLANTDKNTEVIFNIPRTFWRHAREGTIARAESKSNKREFTFHDGEASYYIGTAGSKGFARGATLHRAHLSEVAYYPGDYDTQDNFLAGVDEAASHGEVTLETTANGASGLFYELWQGAQSGDNDWCPIYLGWWLGEYNRDPLTDEQFHELAASITDEEKALIERTYRDYSTVLEPGQIAWRRRMIRRRGRLFQQEHPETAEQAFIRSGDCFFDQEIVTERLGTCRKPLRREHIPGGYLTVWHEPAAEREYFVGADCAEGVETGDWSTICIFDDLGRQCAEWRGHFPARQHARLITEAATLYKHGDRLAFTAVEIQNHGGAVMDSLIRDCGFPKRDLFKHSTVERDKTRKSKKLGWTTTAATRPKIIQDLRQGIHDGSLEINSRTLLQECLTFVGHGDGSSKKYAAESGKHDDDVFGWGIAWQARLAPKPVVAMAI